MAADSKSCNDINECLNRNGGCAQLCNNTDGSHECGCREGFSLSHDRRRCFDVNECAVENGGCDHVCNNTYGSFDCFCNSGFTLAADGASCADIDECAEGNGGCGHTCVNTNGSYACECRSGFALQGDGKSCLDIDECADFNGGCMHNCTNEVGSFSCSCDDGYVLDADKASCNDVNECETGNGGCEQICTNTPGSYVCSCKASLAYVVDTGDDHKCSYLCKPGDLHVANPLDCSTFFYCLFTGTAHQRVELRNCAPGTLFNPEIKVCDWPGRVKCAGEKSASSEHKFGDLLPDPSDCRNFKVYGNGVMKTCPRGTHFNALLSVCDWPQAAGCERVDCDIGFEVSEDGKKCMDLDECSYLEHGCQQKCVNTAGSFHCACNAGFTLKANKKTCQKEKKIVYDWKSELTAFPGDCGKYYQSVHGKKIVRTCAPGLHFNAATKQCDWPQAAGCEKRAKRAAYDWKSELSAFPGDCNKYYQNVHGKKMERSCQPGLHFNADLKVCDWPQAAGCESRAKRATYDWKTELSAFPGDCGKYYQNVHGKKMVRSCQAGLHFNAATKHCDWPANAKCA